MAKSSIPKKYSGLMKTAIDPLGIGIGDAVFGKEAGPDYSKEEAEQLAAMEAQRAATDEYIRSGAGKYDVGQRLATTSLGESKMGGISTDPRYREAELSALKDLENQSKEGFSATDRAAMARTEMEANRANRGRQGAIQQNMQSRGMGGSGMDLVAQMASSQDANDMEALRALEREGQAQNLRQGATAKMGGMAGSMQERDFAQAAQKAQAADQIARFNNQLANYGSEANWNRANMVGDKNVASKTAFNQNVLGAKQGQAQQNYDYSVEGQNRSMMRDAEAEKRAGGVMSAIGGIGGGVVGGIYGGPAGAAAGSQVGSGVGRQVGTTNYRNNKYASDEQCKENIRSEHPLEIEAFLESLSPKSFDFKMGEGDGGKNKHGIIAQDLEKSNIGRGIVVEDEGGVKNISMPDAISALFEAVSHLNKKMKG